MNAELTIDQIEKFVRINNRKAFLLDKIPEYYPGTRKHIDFWREQKKRCIEGYWGLDGEAYRWMPGVLYFYGNFATIIHNDKDTGYAIGEKARPWVRDVEWEAAYNYYECLGFSGFIDDDEYTCDIRILDIKSISDLNPNSPRDRYLINSNGELKSYITTRKYLRKLHDSPKGIALFFNPIKNLFLLGTRSFGKSVFIGGGVMAHRFLFDGLELAMKPYTPELQPTTQRIVIGAGSADKSSETLEKFTDTIDNLPGKVFDGKTLHPPPFYKENKGTLNSNNGINVFRHEYDVKVGSKWEKKGSRTSIKHVVYPSHRAESAVGGRFGLSVVEEVGLVPNVIAVHAANDACQRVGDKMGVTIFIGTGGNFEKVRESEIIFRNPDQYDVLAFEDTYEGMGKIGWFMPRHYGLNQFKDENGNTDLEKAHEYLINERKSKLTGSQASITNDSYVMSYPIVPSEMFLSDKGNIFPVIELRNRLKNLRNNNEYLSLGTPVSLYWDNGVCKYDIEEGFRKQPLWDTRLHLTYKSKEGCPIIYEFPRKINGVVPNDMYIIGVDPFKQDGDGDSMASIYVIKTYQYALEGHGYSQIVAEYTGRPKRGRNAVNEIIEKLADLYGNPVGGIFYEGDVGNVKDYFIKNKKEILLAPRPDYLLSNKAYQRTFTEYGVSTSNRIVKEKIIDFLVEWLLEERERKDNGLIIRNLDLVPSIRFLEEAITFSYESGNYDNVMGLAMGVIGLRAKYNEFKHSKKEQTKETSMYNWLNSNNKVFTRHKTNGRLFSQAII